MLRVGPSLETLLELAKQTGARGVFWNRRYEPAVAARDARVDAALRARGLATSAALGLPSANLLWEPEALTTKAGQPFRMFTPFWRACRELPRLEPAAAPRELPAPRRWPASVPLAALGLRPKISWDAGIRAAWSPGEASARAALKRFVGNGLAQYADARNRPDLDASSRLSPHLHFGEIGPRAIWSAVERAAERSPIDPAPFLRELAWREFAYHLLHHFPHSTEAPLRPEFLRFPWAPATAARAWRRGQTGYPLVDAGMRELWATGFLPNRVRMVVASFLVKHLLVRWQEGARHFWDTLVDADLANNTLGWQWSAGSGVDAAPYFRIFNPVIQGRDLRSHRRLRDPLGPGAGQAAAAFRSRALAGARRGAGQRGRRPRTNLPATDRRSPLGARPGAGRLRRDRLGRQPQTDYLTLLRARPGTSVSNVGSFRMRRRSAGGSPSAARFMSPPSSRAISTSNRFDFTERGSASATSVDVAHSSRCLMSSHATRFCPARARRRTRTHEPCSFWPNSVSFNCPAWKAPSTSELSGFQVPRSQIITVPPPYSPAGMTPSNRLYSSG